MKVVSTIILVILVLLAASSGITKILLLQQDVDFFGRYGFTHPMIVGFGLTQLIGAVLMVFTKTRFVGAAMVAATFLASLSLLLMERNIPVSIITVVATLLLVEVMRRSRRTTQSG